MRITQIDITQSFLHNGLKPIKMERLGQIVLLTGKNGSGKTRLLNTIFAGKNTKPRSVKIDATEETIKDIEDTIERIQSQIQKLKDGSGSKSEEKERKQKEKILQECKNRINNYNKTKITGKGNTDWQIIKTDGKEEDYEIIYFVPKNLDMIDSNSLTKKKIINESSAISVIGIDYLATGTFARIQLTQDRWFNATHQDSSISGEEKETAIDDYNKLNELIRIVLNTELDRDVNGDTLLFGFPLGKSKLSDGQKVLLQLCLAIHCQQLSLENIILFMDEPENHLHPSVVIDIIERIQNKMPQGQIWIATHSLSLLSYFDPSSIWCMDDGEVSYAGKIPEKVLNSLLGDEDKISKLHDFISLPGILALYQYAFESLFHPTSIQTDKNDPQTLQIQDEIKRHMANSEKIRILDFGVGKGRLLSNIIENNQEPMSEFIKWFDYIAFDECDKDSEMCKVILKDVYPADWEKRYFNEFSQLLSHNHKENFDIVVMCNVLHEIDPIKWLDLFKKDGKISRLLHEKGILLLVEDQEMQIGEKAYQKGFIVLDTPELKELFRITESDTHFSFSDKRGDGRLKAHRISKDYLIRITPESRIKCLEVLQNTAQDKITAFRNKEITYKNGKKHGFWVQQYANAGLALAELTM